MTKYSFIAFFLIVFMIACKQDKKAPETTASPIENSDEFVILDLRFASYVPI